MNLSQKTPTDSPESSPEPCKRRRAVVIGGSIAGLVTARSLASSFDEVVVLDRDTGLRADGTFARRGAPKENHPHLLMTAGQNVIERHYPGFFEALRCEGVTRVDWVKDLAWHQFGSWKVRFASGYEYFALSRPSLEQKLRTATTQTPSVRIETGSRYSDFVSRLMAAALLGSGASASARAATTL